MTPETLDAVVFYFFAALALVSAVGVVAQRNPIYSAFSLIVTMCSLSAIFGLFGSPFIAALQVVVYAGAIMVLFLFVLMLLNVKTDEPHEGRGLRAVAVVLAVVLVAQVGSVLAGAGLRLAGSFDAGTRQVARVLFEPRFAYAFEATSVLILAALVGAVLLAKKDL